MDILRNKERKSEERTPTLLPEKNLIQKASHGLSRIEKMQSFSFKM